ncbi:MAG: hypothetical protein GX282_02955 [Campylobacteraceae bacterium]|nr:hypothetical protein [Campylobacteraceae bacterium]
MRVLAIFFLLFSSIFGLNINSSLVQKDSIRFGVSDVDYNKIGEVYSSSLMECSPKLDGVFHLENATDLVFYPTKSLPTSSSYSCTFNGAKIDFKTDEFKVVAFESIKKDSFVIAFNDEVLSLEKHIRLSDQTLKFNISKVDSSSYVIDVNNPNSLKYEIFIDSKLANSNSKTLGKEIKLSQMKSVNLDKLETLDLDVSNVKGIAYNGKVLGFRLIFNSYIDLNSLLLKSDGISNFSVRDSGYSYDSVNETYSYYADIVSREFKPNTSYEVTLLEGFGTVYPSWGNVIKDETTFSFTTPNYKKEVNFIDQKPYISNKGGVFINSTNVDEIKTMLSKVEDENIRYFLNFNTTDAVFSEYKTKNFTLDSVLNEDTNSTVKFDGIRDGIYKFDVFYKDGDNLNSVNKYLYFSDIAINAKVFDDSVFVFLNRLSSSEVVSGAKVTLFSDKNKVLATGISNENGVFSFDKKDLSKENPNSLLVELGDERNFLIFSEKNGDGLYKSAVKKPKSYVYLASDIIRPNSELQGVIIVKENFKSLKNLPVKVQIYDPNDSKVYDNAVSLDEFGTIKLHLKDGFTLTGKYSLKVVFENKVLTTKEFSVESFVPQNLKATAKFSKDKFKGGENLGLNLSAAYLFGQSAANLSGNLNVLIHNSSFENEKFSGYKFDDEKEFGTPIYNYNAPILLDKKGNVSFFIKPNFKTKLNSKLEVKTNFMVNDSGKSSSDYATSVIYPFESIVGIKQDENLNFKFVTLNPFNLKETDSKIKATLYEESWNYNFNEKGYISWFVDYKLIDEFNVENGVLNISNLGYGSYKLVAKDLTSTHESAISFSTGGALSPSDRLNLANITLNKASYNLGDTIVANINSPLKEALLLVTLEDEKVLEYQVVQVSNYSATVSFEIKDEFSGMYLSAKALRVADTPSLFLPFKAENSVYVAKDNSDKKIELKMQLIEQSKSNEDFNVAIKTEPNSKVYLFAVDYGILNIISQKIPEAFEYFNTIKEKLFANFDIYNELTHFKTGGKTLAFGSGGMLMSLEKYLDPVDPKDTFIKMYDAVSDASGIANFTLNVPINTKVRVDAIALNDEKISQISKNVVIKDDILVKMPSVLYLLTGDSVELPIRVFNNTDENKVINSSIIASPNLELSSDSVNLNLEPNSFETLNLVVYANNAGDAKISILDTDMSFKVLHNSALNTKVLSGVLDKDKSLSLNDSYKVAKLSFTNSPAALFFKDKEKLISYPYGCAEQTSSRLFALLYSEPKTERETKDRVSFINSGIKSLIQKQKKDGTFGYWDADSKTHKYSSVYTLDTLLTLKEAGFEVFDFVIKDGLKALQNQGMSSELADIYALYLLSQNGIIDESKINIFYDKKFYKDSLVAHYMMAAILQKASLTNEFNKVKKEIDSYNLKNYKEDYDSFSSKVRDLSFAFYLHSKHFGEKNEALLKEIISLRHTISSTQDRAFVLRALNEFEKDSEVSVKVVDGKNIYQIDEVGTLDLNLTSSTLKLSPISKNPYYSFVSYGYEEQPIKHQFDNKSLNIYREFVDMDGNLVDLSSIKLNNIIFAKITLSSLAYYSDVLVHQKAPSCLEIVNERIVQNIRTNKHRDSAYFSYTDISDTAITNFLEPFSGERVFYVPFRAVLKGSCVLPEVRVERMYDETINNYDLERRYIQVW